MKSWKFLFVFTLAFLFIFPSVAFGNKKKYKALADRVGDPKKPIGVNLKMHEGWGGHTIARHCGKNDAFLQGRLKKQKKPKAISTFVSVAVAKKSIDAVIKKKRIAIAKWWKKKKNKPQAFIAIVSTKARIITRAEYNANNSAPSKLYKKCKVRVVLHRKKKFGIFGLYVLTAYPEPLK